MQKNRNPKKCAGGGVQAHPPAIHSRHPDHPEHPVTPRGRPGGTVLGYLSVQVTVTDVWHSGDTLRLTTSLGVTDFVCETDFDIGASVAAQTENIRQAIANGTTDVEADPTAVDTFLVNLTGGSAVWVQMSLPVGTHATLTNGIPVYA